MASLDFFLKIEICAKRSVGPFIWFRGVVPGYPLKGEAWIVERKSGELTPKLRDSD